MARRTSERVFFVGLAVIVLGLAAVDAGLAGRERPYLVFVLIGAVGILWFVTRSGSRVPERWRGRSRSRDADEDPDRE
jgi:hypothetical protein